MRRFAHFILIFICICYWSFASAETTHYIIDTDMGFDDWMAALYLLKQPVPVDAITVDCQGETRCPQGAYNAARLTHLAKRDVPIAYGKSRTLSIYDFPASIREFASNMTVPGFRHLKMNHDLSSRSAAQLIADDVIGAAKHHYQVAIISIGTATNIADAWNIAKKNHQSHLFRQGLKMIYKGGGAFGEIKQSHLTNQQIPGNISIPHLYQSNDQTAEWNIYANAPAMRELVDANLPITFIPNNASDQVPMTKKRYEEILSLAAKHTIARFDANAMQSLISPTYGWKKASAGLYFWDAAATITALESQIVTKEFKHVPIEIITRHGNDYSATWVTPSSTHDVTVFYNLNKQDFYRYLLKSIV